MMQRTAQQDAEENAILEQARKIEADRRAEDAARQQEEAARAGGSAGADGPTVLSQSVTSPSCREAVDWSSGGPPQGERALEGGQSHLSCGHPVAVQEHCFSSEGGCVDRGCMPSQIVMDAVSLRLRLAFTKWKAATLLQTRALQPPIMGQPAHVAEAAALHSRAMLPG